jgi:hypothetical protein
MLKNYRTFLLVMLLMIGNSFLSLAQKPNYTFTFKVYINEDAASFYGGHAAIQDSITRQFARVSQYYNSESRFLATYTFTPAAFAYYTESGANENQMDAINFSAAETAYNYRVIYSRSPYGGGNANILSDYSVDQRSIRFALNAEAEWGQSLFGATPTKILCHEIGHSRGAYDMYSGNVTAANNQIYNDVSYNYSVPSIMNYLYDSNANWDTYSIYCINTTAGNIHTSTTWGNLFWSMFPSSFAVRVKDNHGNPMANAKVTLYGVRWLSTAINASDAFVYYTDAQGLVTFDGTNSTNNPFHRTGTNIVSDFANFMVVTSLGSQGFINWMNVFDVQLDKLNNQSYFLDYTLDAPPTVSLTAPSNNATYSAPASITLNATAADVDGTVSKVEFYNGATLLGTSATSPYTYTWSNVAAGTYTLTAMAYDNSGITTTSSTINVTVSGSSSGCTAPQYVAGTTYATNATVLNNGHTYQCTVGGWCSSSAASYYAPGTGSAWQTAWNDLGACTGNQAPTVSLTAPANNATYTAPAAVTIMATAADTDGTISKVEFYNGTTLLSTKMASPYTYTWTGVTVGSYSLTAKAYDNLNASTTSATVHIAVNSANQAPTVSLTAPANNATYTAPAAVNITATATDADGTISKVEFYNGTTLLATETASPYTYTWSSVAAGTYSLTAKAYDNLGAVITSGVVTITVNGSGTCTAAQWVSGTAYTNGMVVQYLGVKYVANYWTQGDTPSTHNGGAGSGQPWTSQGTCTARIGELDDFATVTSVTINPNPADVNTTVAVSLATADDVTVEIYDLMGKKILNVYSGVLDAGQHNFDLNMASYNQGTYILLINGSQIRKSVKFVKR